MPIYSIEMKVRATAYIKASSEAEALRKARELEGKMPIILNSEGEVEISGLSYNDPALPEVSLSPAMTIHEPWDGDAFEEVD